MSPSPLGPRRPASSGDPAVRPTVRAIVLDVHDRVLLQAHLDPGVHRRDGRPHAAPVWIAPGGGLGLGEDPATGVAREVAEETGLTEVVWGPWLWRRVVELHYRGAWRRFEESYRLGRVVHERPAVRPGALDEQERTTIRGHAWWTLADLRSTDRIVYPPLLADRIADLLAHGAPATLIDISGDG